jgi:hypothetical protein
MQRCPPRYRWSTLQELEDGLQLNPEPERKRTVRKRRKASDTDAEPVFDVKRWRVPSHWRNDRRVGDVAISKMLRGIDPDRYEELSA